MIRITKENKDQFNTLGELRRSGYKSRSVKEELRENLIQKLQGKEVIFKGVMGYDDTVIPDLQRAILSRHNINLLGLRGQAKTRIARAMVELLDDYIPVIAGSELNEDPFHPITGRSKALIENMGDKTPISWLSRNERYIEKLATPDVSVADLIGDIDPIKAVNEKLAYNDERVIHFGLVPRANRGIFVLNEIPDLQARIQVSLFNILQEKDIQIRGFSFRIPLDIQFVFTANPEDYTNRGSIVTPLKDRIGSQILTHYPKNLQVAMEITRQEANLNSEQLKTVEVHPLLAELIEQVVFEARDNEFVDAKSGVSARLSISAYENLVSAAERRTLLAGDKKTLARVTDLYGMIPAITGKIEMVYEGELEGPYQVALSLIGKAIRNRFSHYFGDPEKLGRKENDPFSRIVNWFEKGNTVNLPLTARDSLYARELNRVSGLGELVTDHIEDSGKMDRYLWMEFVLYGLAEYSRLSKIHSDQSAQFGDLVGSMLGSFSDDPL
ncbi:MAG: sigma 54-interacting transcriptional regulator [Flavobacteriales bacterium]|nr:sigma 54-interacting transcriptional regulator [Flavobacteriales bacterium]